MANVDGSSSDACVPTYGGGDGQESDWGIGVDVLRDIQALLNIFGPGGQRHSVQFVKPAPP